MQSEKKRTKKRGGWSVGKTVLVVGDGMFGGCIYRRDEKIGGGAGGGGVLLW